MSRLLLLPQLPEGTDRIPAYVALQAEPAVAQRSDLFSSYPLSRKDPGKDQIKDRRLCIHSAGGDTEDRNQCGVRSGECGVIHFGMRIADCGL